MKIVDLFWSINIDTLEIFLKIFKLWRITN